MKKVLVLVITLFAAGALACPNLQGSYSCVDQTGEVFNEEVVQSVDNNITVYEMSGDTFITDGVRRTERVDTETVVSWSTCNGDTLSVNADINSPAQNAKFEMRVNVAPTATGFYGSGTAKIYVNGGVFDEFISTTCTRL